MIYGFIEIATRCAVFLAWRSSTKQYDDVHERDASAKCCFEKLIEFSIFALAVKPPTTSTVAPLGILRTHIIYTEMNKNRLCNVKHWSWRYGVTEADVSSRR